MNPHSAFECKFASMLIGVVVVVLGFLIGAPSDEPLHMILEARGRADDFGLVLVILGFMTFYGSVKPKRACRQLGLTGDAFMLLMLFGVVMTNWGLSFATLLLLVFGVSALALLAVDILVYGRRNVQGT